MVPFHTNFYQNFHVSKQTKRTIGAHRDISTQNQRRDLYGARGGSTFGPSSKMRSEDRT